MKQIRISVAHSGKKKEKRTLSVCLIDFRVVFGLKILKISFHLPLFFYELT